MTIRVMLVDDQVLLRTGFRMVLAAQPDMEVVAEAGDGVEALQVLRETPVDVVENVPAHPASAMPGAKVKRSSEGGMKIELYDMSG